MSKDKKKKDVTEKAEETSSKTSEEKENEVKEEKATETTEEKAQPKQEEKKETPEKSECDKLKEELAATKDRYLRIAAEYENYRRRTEKEKQAIYSDATADAVKEILAIGDSLERALEAVEKASDESKKGIELITNQYFKALKALGVEPFGEEGDKFDPNLHNAVSATEKKDTEKDTVTAVYQTGYKIGDKVIRHAMVQVNN